jgi:hypothetical protein
VNGGFEYVEFGKRLLRKLSTVTEHSEATYLGIPKRFDTFAKKVIGACVKGKPEPPFHQVNGTAVFGEKVYHLGDVVFENVEVGNSLLVEMRT